MDELMTIREAALYLNVSVATMNRKIKSGELQHTKIGGLVRFQKHRLDSYLDEHTYTGFAERDTTAS